MVNKEHCWGFYGGTFWSIRLISNSRRLGLFFGKESGSSPIFNQNLLPPNRHVNLNLACDYRANISCKIARVRLSVDGDGNGVSPGIHEIFYHAISLLARLIICGMEKSIWGEYAGKVETRKTLAGC